MTAECRGEGGRHAGIRQKSRDVIDAVARGPCRACRRSRWACSRSLRSEAAFFGTLIMTYVYFLRQTTHGEPNPSQVFRLPMVLAASACLFSSSATIYAAEKALRRDGLQAFLGWWGLTIVLGVLFLLGTMLEWNDLIGRWGLTISRNLFGTTYFTLVGFHALHVTIGVIVMSIVFGLAWRRQITAAGRDRRGSRLLVLALRGWLSGRWFLPWCISWDVETERSETVRMTSSIDEPVDRPGRDTCQALESVEMPQATAWPIVLALGITLLGAGLVTSLALSVVGRCCSSSAWVAGSGNCYLVGGTGTTHGRAGAPSPARRREAGHCRPAPTRHGGLSVPAPREDPSDLRRGQGGYRGRPGDAHPGAGLRADQRPWPLVPRSICWRGWSYRESAARPRLSSSNSHVGIDDPGDLAFTPLSR